jgi:hypothetical protein
MRRLDFTVLCTLLLGAAGAHAQITGPGHLDVLLSSEPGPGGTRIVLGYNGNLSFYVPGGTALTDRATGLNIYPGRFGEFPGGQGTLVTGSDDPGFQAFAGTFGSRESFHYRALGSLQLWTPNEPTWGPPAGGEGVVLFGKLPPALSQCVLLNPPASLNCGFYKAGTRFRADGIVGPVDALLVGRTGTNGAFHDHLDWFLEDTRGSDPATGAYLVQLQLFSDAKLGGKDKYLPSDPFFVMFNHGLSQTQYLAAIDSRVHPIPEPGVAALLAAGLVGVLWTLRRRNRPAS